MSGPRSYGRGAAVLSAGIGVTGLVTYTFFSLASHSLADDEYGRITLLWSAVFVVVSVIYRPVEQLLSRTIAERGADAHVLRVAATIQAGLAVAFLLFALLFRGHVEDGLFGGSEAAGIDVGVHGRDVSSRMDVLCPSAAVTGPVLPPVSAYSTELPSQRRYCTGIGSVSPIASFAYSLRAIMITAVKADAKIPMYRTTAR